MAAPEPKTPSLRLLDAAAAEKWALEQDLSHLIGRRALLQSELRSIDISVRELRRRLKLVEEIAGDHEPRALRAVPKGAAEPRETLRGAAIRRLAGQVAARSDDPQRPRHYVEWFQELLDAGYAVAGRDPLAAFLTQLGRSPAIQRKTEPGTYALDFGAVRVLEARLVALNEQLARLQHGQQTIEEITSIRDERERLVRAVAEAERALAEAIATLHPAELA